MSEENINTGTAEFNISGIANVNETLTLVKKSDDPDGNGEFNYKWESSSDGINWENIGEGISYEITPSEENKQLRAHVSYTDNKGNSEKIFAKTNNVQGESLCKLQLLDGTFSYCPWSFRTSFRTKTNWFIQ